MLTSSTVSPPLPSLNGGHNFRDLGGHVTIRGDRVLNGKLYRSGVMAGLDADDMTALARLGIRSIFDLRNASERATLPTPWQAMGAHQYDHGPEDRLSGDLFALLTDASATPDTVRSLMLELYRALPFEHAGSYRTVMRRIAAAELPLIFHCSAGKDRTGVLAALILTLLDVSHADVMRDYVLTNQLADHRGSVLFRRAPAQAAAAVREELLVPLLHADPDYLAAMFGAIDDRVGGTQRYFTDVLELDERHIASIRKALLAPEPVR